MPTDRLSRLLRFFEQNPDDSFLAFAIAKEYEKQNQPDRALKYYLDLRQRDPDYVGTYYHLGKLYEQREEWKKAFETYGQGMEVARRIGDRHALGELAGARLNLGDEEDFE